MNPKTNSPRQPDIPPDVEARYKEIQAEMQQLQLAPEALAGETREARYAREQRLRKLRREFDAMSRYPLARRQRSGAMTVVLMASIAVLLCMLSVGGGFLVNTILSRPPDISGTISDFMDSIKNQDYSGAYRYLAGAQDVQAFSGTADLADQAMGKVTGYHKISQVGGNSGDAVATVTFSITRAGNDGSNSYEKFPQHTFPSIVIHLDYVGGSWQISDVGSLFTVLKASDLAPTPTTTPGK